jgi:hypothetical protein
MLSTFPFDPCSSEKILDYSGVPGIFGFHKIVLLTACCFFLLWPRRFPVCSALPPPLTAGAGHPSATSSCSTPPRVLPSRLRLLLSSLVASPTRATATRAVSGRHLLAVVASSLQCLNYHSLARSSTTPTSTCCFANPSVQFLVTELNFAAAVCFLSGRAPPARGQPTADHLRRSQRSYQLPRDLLVLADPLISPNFHWSSVLDERRHRRRRPPPWADRCRYSHTTTTP